MSEVVQGDCVDVLPALRGQAALVYVDPPFFTNQKWTGSRGSFDDHFDGILGYLDWLQARLQAMCLALSWNGVLAVHLDDHASHYVAVFLDWAFGPGHRIGVVTWKRSHAHGGVTKNFGRIHDTILFYSLGPDWTFHPPENGDANSGLWLDIVGLHPRSKERTGYPTQKPVALLERIIATFTEPGDLVVDPMCGSGTALVAAERLGRRAFGCDINDDAIDIAARRIGAPLQGEPLGAAS